MYSFYLCTLIVIVLIFIGGWENTLRLFDFIDITVKYLYVRTKSWFVLIRIQKDLGVEPTTLLDFLTEDNK
jgi:NADH:ubiquinone oxidoreductase subunit H